MTTKQFDRNKTYWNSKGKYQEHVPALQKQVPFKGKAEKRHIDLFRLISNIYYDHYNNGSCNWENYQEDFAVIEYYEQLFAEIALAEGAGSIYRLTAYIRETLDGDLAYEKSYLGQDDPNFKPQLEKLLDIIILYAHQQQQAKS